MMKMPETFREYLKSLNEDEVYEFLDWLADNPSSAMVSKIHDVVFQ